MYIAMIKTNKELIIASTWGTACLSANVPIILINDKDVMTKQK